MSAREALRAKEALREGIREVLLSEASREAVHRFVDSGALRDGNLWDRAAELGWFALTLPEAHGGLGLAFEDLAVLYEELGRFVAPLPFLGTMLAAEAIARAGTPAQQAAWLPRIVAGETAAAVAMTDTVRVRRQGSGLILDGEAADLLDGAAASLLLIQALDEEGLPAWLLVEPAGDGVAATAEPLADPTRHFGRLRFESHSLPAERLLAGPAAAVTESLRVHAALALACDAAGGGAAVLEQTLDYLKTRQQFGRPIGSFQALKHRCADHKVALEASGAVVAEAVADPASALQASIAKLYACSVYGAVAADAVQLHGGIGLTWEHDCHLFLKRAKLNEALFGDGAWQADRAARLLLETA